MAPTAPVFKTPSLAQPVRFLVTGATGFVGRHLAPRLLHEGPVTTLQRPDGPHPVPTGCSASEGDITKPRDLDGLPSVDIVVHLAGEASPQRTAQDPILAHRVNVDGTRNVAAWAARQGARLVFLSTGHVYGPPRGRPFRETDPLHPASPYARTKADAEAALQPLVQQGLSCTTLRCFNMYGPGQTGPYVVPALMEALAHGHTPTLRDLAPARDFLYISDAVEAMALAALRRDTPKVLNVASGQAHTIGEVAAIASALAGIAPPTGPYISADRVEADTHRLRALGWAPQATLDVGLRHTLDWWRGKP